MSLRIGLVVHPRRDLTRPLHELRDWAQDNGASLGQLEVPGREQQVEQAGEVDGCDLVLAVGGDGTALAAIRAAAPMSRPGLGIACGSLGVLTSVAADKLADALSRFAAGEWQPVELPALEVRRDGENPLLAYNDVAVARSGEGQVRTRAYVDGELYVRLAGDGVVVSTPIGSSAYAMAAGGPLLVPGTQGFLFTPLPSHAGSCPPLVLEAGSRLDIEIGTRRDGARLEVDGKIQPQRGEALSIRLRPGAAKLVRFAGQESPLAGLRRRGVISDSPRLVAEAGRPGR